MQNAARLHSAFCIQHSAFARRKARVMIPLRHTHPTRTVAAVNRALVVGNVVVFLVQIFLGARAEALIQTFGYIPARLFQPAGFGYAPWEAAMTLVTSLFLHGG